MNVYTFFEPILGWNSDKKLLDLWVKNWSMAGFNPIVFSQKDAKLNPSYESFVENISKGFKDITGYDIVDDNPWSFYVFNNYIRFLSYANVKSTDPILVMDYDVYNINYKKHIYFPENIVFQYSNTPCLVSGTPNNFQKYCDMMSSTIINLKSALKYFFDESPYTTFHEMCFLHCMRNTGQYHNDDIKKVLSDSNFCFVDPKNSILDNKENKQLVHVSNEYLHKYCVKNSIDNLTFDQKIDIRHDLALKEIGKDSKTKRQSVKLFIETHYGKNSEIVHIK